MTFTRPDRNRHERRASRDADEEEENTEYTRVIKREAAPRRTGRKTRTAISETGEPGAHAGKRAGATDARVGSSLIRIRRGLFSVGKKEKREEEKKNRRQTVSLAMEFFHPRPLPRQRGGSPVSGNTLRYGPVLRPEA